MRDIAYDTENEVHIASIRQEDVDAILNAET